MSDNNTSVAIKQEASAVWDAESINIFCDECIRGHRHGTHFSKIGWENVVNKFNNASGKTYTRVQLKNKWDSLKVDWNLWRPLIGKETGLGWDYGKKTVVADKEWWEKKIKVSQLIDI